MRNQELEEAMSQEEIHIAGCTCVARTAAGYQESVKYMYMYGMPGSSYGKSLEALHSLQ